nr:hypothetical protein [Tanacetum cinerariifolium]
MFSLEVLVDDIQDLVETNTRDGTSEELTMRICRHVGKHTLHILVDCGSTRNFLDLDTARKLGCQLSALEETSSTDTGVQEEWSGLSFQNPEPSNDIFQQNNSFQNASSINSRPEHLKTANPSFSVPGSLQSHQALSGPHNDMEFKKGLLAEHQRQSKASEATAIKSSDSTSMSATVDRSADFSALDSNAQTSRHMVELLNKIHLLHPPTPLPRSTSA